MNRLYIFNFSKAVFFSIVVFLTVLGGALLFFYFLLLRLGEHNDYDAILDAQLKNGSVYRSKLHYQTVAYKTAAINHLRPDVILLGTSTATTYQQEHFFYLHFYNAFCTQTEGGTLEGYYELLDGITPSSAPKKILISLDSFLLALPPNQPKQYPRSFIGKIVSCLKNPDPLKVDSNIVILIRKLISEPESFLNSLLADNGKVIGFIKKRNSGAFRIDGSGEISTSTTFSSEAPINLNDLFLRPPEKGITLLKKILHKGKKLGAEVVVFFPPINPLSLIDNPNFVKFIKYAAISEYVTLLKTISAGCPSQSSSFLCENPTFVGMCNKNLTNYPLRFFSNYFYFSNRECNNESYCVDNMRRQLKLKDLGTYLLIDSRKSLLSSRNAGIASSPEANQLCKIIQQEGATCKDYTTLPGVSFLDYRDTIHFGSATSLLVARNLFNQYF
ncbi:MAG: hypothetical protein HQK53_12235 [Oligoflexia bacterium]|nr:hypothetical protein [Oligoflexia bacterium]